MVLCIFGTIGVMMAKSIGVTLSERVVAGLVVDNALAGPLRVFPENHDDEYALVEMPSDAIVDTLCSQVIKVAAGATDIACVGVGLPGLIKNGIVEDAPNLSQLKGTRVKELLGAKLKEHGLDATVNLVNDADGFAAGVAAKHGRLDSIIRVWTLGVGIGYGRYPFMPGIWEGGHTTVSLDDKENFCGCGGRGHMEGIMGHRAMRLRFLDMEPEEVFEAADKGDARCLEFKKLWHKALAAGTATSIHLDGPGKFFLAGFNVRFVDLGMLKDYVQKMVKFSPLQAYSMEIVADEADTRVIGAAVAAGAGGCAIEGLGDRAVGRQSMMERASNAAFQRWLKIAAACCVSSLVSASVLCVGCSVREENSLGQAQDRTTYALAFGAYLSVVVFMVALACAVVCLSTLLAEQRRSR